MTFFISRKLNGKKGFTLIELLVVISIIALLSTIVLASVSSARAKARDRKRMLDLKQVQNAIELYYSTYGVYPTTGAGWRGNCLGYGGFGITGSNGWVPDVAPTYISVLPLDPKPANGVHGCYLYSSNGTDYKILAEQTVESFPVVASVCQVPYGFRDWRANASMCTLAIWTQGATNW